MAVETRKVRRRSGRSTLGNLGLKWRNATVRSNVGNDLDEYR
jgi:hypothetical protein